MARGTGKHSTSKSSFSCKKDSSGKEPLQYCYHQLENMFLFVQHLWAPNVVTLSSFPFVPDLAVTFFIYSTCCCFTTVGLCCLLFCLISSCWQIFVLFFHIKSFQDICITRPDGRSFILLNPQRDVDDAVFSSYSVLIY